jgi:hypothetical protein
LRTLSIDARVAERADGPSRGTVVITAFGEPVQGRGSLEVPPDVRDSALQLYADARTAGRDALIIWFGHPRLATAFGDEAPLLVAWSGDTCMQAAAARWLAKHRG